MSKLEETCVLVCFNCCHRISRTLPLPPSLLAHQSLALELGSWIIFSLQVRMLPLRIHDLARAGQKPLCWERNGLHQMQKIILKTSREPWDFKSDCLQKKKTKPELSPQGSGKRNVVLELKKIHIIYSVGIHSKGHGKYRQIARNSDHVWFIFPNGKNTYRSMISIPGSSYELALSWFLVAVKWQGARYSWLTVQCFFLTGGLFFKIVDVLLTLK